MGGKTRKLLKVGMHDEDMFDREKRIPWIKFNQILKSKALIVGAGALGNEVGKNLVLSGFKNITIVDMDKIVKSNLSRCALFRIEDAEQGLLKAEVLARELKNLDKSIKVSWYSKPIQELPDDFLKQFDIIFGCLDNIMARLYINSHAYYYGIPLVDGGTLGTSGKVQVVIPPRTSCIECGMNKTHFKNLEQVFSCSGREDVTIYSPKLPAEITTTAVIAALQVLCGIKIISKEYAALPQNLIYYDGYRNVFEVLEVPLNANCPNHVVQKTEKKGKKK
ncbi:MAG: ThiF family adenylyltransferase [Thermoplasmata archaeon]